MSHAESPRASWAPNRLRLGRERVSALVRFVPAALIALGLAWCVANLARPLRLPRPGADELATATAAVSVAREAGPFAELEKRISSRTLFAPPVPIIAKATGAVVIESLLKKVSLAGITTIGGKPAAIIRVNGKSALYRKGDKVSSFNLKDVAVDKVVLEIDGQTVDLTR